MSCSSAYQWVVPVAGSPTISREACTITFGLEPHGLSDLAAIAAIALKSNGKLSPETLEQFGHRFTKEILTLVENTASGCKRPRR
jgi:hypothetical protein